MPLAPYAGDSYEIERDSIRSLGKDLTLLIMNRKSDNNALIVAVDGKSGETRWDIEPGDSKFFLREVKRGKRGDTVLISGKKFIELRNATDGKLIFGISGRNSLTEAVQDDSGDIYACERAYEKGTLQRIDGTTGQVALEKSMKGEPDSPVIGPDDNLYCTATIFKNHSRHHSRVYGIHPGSGTILWEKDLSLCSRANGVSRSGNFYSLMEDGQVAVIDCSSGKEKSRVSLEDLGIKSATPLHMEVIEGDKRERYLIHWMR